MTAGGVASASILTKEVITTAGAITTSCTTTKEIIVAATGDICSCATSKEIIIATGTTSKEARRLAGIKSKKVIVTP